MTSACIIVLSGCRGSTPLEARFCAKLRLITHSVRQRLMCIGLHHAMWLQKNSAWNVKWLDSLCSCPAGPAEIIEQKAGQDGSTSYYVHYVDCEYTCQHLVNGWYCDKHPARATAKYHWLNLAGALSGDKRLDEWVQQSRLAPFITKPMDQMDVLTPRLSTMASLNA